jgi:hypothetical protein
MHQVAHEKKESAQVTENEEFLMLFDYSRSITAI